jgi:Rrf2 family protein
MLAITKQSDYGLIMISFIYKRNRLVKLSELIEETKLPRRFLARIAAELTKKGLFVSREGKSGGYLTASKIKTTSLYDYLKIFEKDVVVCDCVDNDYICKFDKVCSHNSYIKKKLNIVLTQELKKVKLLDLIK